MRPVRRARGMLLRLALRRRVAMTLGMLLVVPAVAVLWGEYRWESGVSDGLVSVMLATGVALISIAMSGPRPDWVDDRPD